MSLIINSIAFDTYKGVFHLPRTRTAVFRLANKPYVGLQRFPSVSPNFPILTTRYEPYLNRREFADSLTQLVGTVVSINQDGLIFAYPPTSVRFAVIDVEHMTIDTVSRVCGTRAGLQVNLAPAGRIITQWTLTAVPA